MAATPIAIDMTNAAPLLKVHYSPRYVETLAFGKSPLPALLAKDPAAGGTTVNYPVISDDVGGRSHDMSIAETDAGTIGIQGTQVALPLIEDFAAFSIKGMTIEASRGKPDAFMSALTFAIDSSMRKLGRAFSTDIYRGGYGVIGTVGALTGSQITLQRKQDAINFNRGQSVFFAPDEVSDARVGGTLVVSGIDHSTGIITFTAAVSGITSLAAGDVVIGAGDRATTSVSSRLKLYGLKAWITTKPSAANDLTAGWDRRTSSAFYGTVQDVSTTGGDVMNSTIELIDEVNRLGGNVDLVTMNPSRATDLRKILQSQSMYESNSIKSSVANITFKSFVFHGADVVEDRFCPVDDVWCLTRSSWEVTSLGNVPKILNLDGNQFLRAAGVDGYVGRSGYYGNLKCEAPLWNGRLILPQRT